MPFCFGVRQCPMRACNVRLPGFTIEEAEGVAQVIRGGHRPGNDGLSRCNYLDSRLPARKLFILSLTCGIDEEMEQRYSEAQIPDLVAYANAKVLEATSGHGRLLPRTDRVRTVQTAVRPFRFHTASKSMGLAFASSSAGGQRMTGRGPGHCNQISSPGGHRKH